MTRPSARGRQTRARRSSNTELHPPGRGMLGRLRSGSGVANRCPEPPWALTHASGSTFGPDTEGDPLVVRARASQHARQDWILASGLDSYAHLAPSAASRPCMVNVLFSWVSAIIR